MPDNRYNRARSPAHSLHPPPSTPACNFVQIVGSEHRKIGKPAAAASSAPGKRIHRERCAPWLMAGIAAHSLSLPLCEKRTYSLGVATAYSHSQALFYLPWKFISFNIAGSHVCERANGTLAASKSASICARFFHLHIPVAF